MQRSRPRCLRSLHGSHVLLIVGVIGVPARAASQRPVERDSSGIHIIENPSRASAPLVFRLGAPILSLGGAATTPDEEIISWAGAVRLSDGSVSVANGIRIQNFDSRGKLLTAVGGRGSGPSEFRVIGKDAFCATRGDTLVAGDDRNGRYAVIHGARVVQTVPYTRDFGGMVAGCFDDGTILMMGGLPNSKVPTYTIRIARLRLDGTLLNRIGEFTVRTPTSVEGMTPPQVVVAGQLVYIGDATTSEIRAYDATGRLKRIVRTADPVQQTKASDFERPGASTIPGAWRPATFPAYRWIRADAERRLWVQSFAVAPTPKDREAWTALDVDGRIVGRLEFVPEQLGKLVFVLGFGLNEVLIAASDDDGFRHLTWYRIERVRS